MSGSAESVDPADTPVFRVVDVTDVHVDLPAQYPVVTLQECEPPLRQLTFPVGMPEGTALSQAMRRLPTPRPLSHQLLADVLARFQVDVVAVRLTGRQGGTYLAELDLMGARGREVVACRPSDGLVLALRMPVAPPILCDQRLFDEAGDVDPG